MSRNSSLAKSCSCSACLGLRTASAANADQVQAAEQVGLVSGIKEVLLDPRVAIFTVSAMVGFVLMLMFVLNLVPWGTGKGCWVQC